MRSINKNRILKLTMLTLAAAALLFAASTGYAIQFEGYKLIASITAKETFDDNYFLVNGDLTPELEAWVTTVTPDVKLIVGDTTKFTLGFKSDLILVEGFSMENRQNQTYTARFDYNPGGPFSFSLADTLIDAEDQASRPNTDRGIRVQNDLTSTIKYKLGERAGIETILLWSIYDHNVFNLQLTRHEYQGTLRGTYRVAPHTLAFIGYRYSNFLFTGLPFILTPTGKTAEQLDMDNQAHAIQAGLRFEQAPMGGGKLQGEIWVGYEKIDFERQTDQDELVVEGRLTYLPTELTKAVLSLKREHTASTLTTGSNSINSSVRLDLTYKFMEKLEGTLGGSFKNTDYVEPLDLRGTRVERNDDTFTFKAGLKYKFYKYFTAGVDYQLIDKSVDPVALRTSEYQENKLTFMLNGTF